MTRGKSYARGVVVLGAGGKPGGELVAALRRHLRDALTLHLQARTHSEHGSFAAVAADPGARPV